MSIVAIDISAPDDRACKGRNNCNQCKAARSSAKAGESERKRDKQQKLRMNDYE